jgi:hypothetical protein
LIQLGSGSSILGQCGTGFNDQKFFKFKLKKNRIFDIFKKLQFICTKASMKDVKATEEAFSPNKRTSSTFSNFEGYYCPPESESGSSRSKSMRIRILNKKCAYFHEISSHFSYFLGHFSLLDPDQVSDPADQNQCGSVSTTVLLGSVVDSD